MSEQEYEYIIRKKKKMRQVRLGNGRKIHIWIYTLLVKILPKRRGMIEK